MAEHTNGAFSTESPDAAKLVCEIERSQIIAMSRAGNDLFIHTTLGTVIQVEGFFLKSNGASDLLLIRESDGSMWQVVFSQNGNSTVMSEYIPYDANAVLAKNVAVVDPLEQGSADAEPAEAVSTMDALKEGAADAALTEDVATVAPVEESPAEAAYFVAIQSYTESATSKTGADGFTIRLNGVAKGMQIGDQVRIYEGDTLLGVAEVDANGNWFFDVTSTPGGRHVYLARIVTAEGLRTDAVGNLALDLETPSSLSIPSLPLWIVGGLGVAGAVVAIAHNDSGSGNNDSPSSPTNTPTIRIVDYTSNTEANLGNAGNGTITNDPTPTLNGTVTGLRAGGSIRIYEDSTLLGTATVSGQNWTFAVPHTSDGTHTYVAVLADVLGNDGTIRSQLTLTVDTTAPTQTVTIDSIYDNAGQADNLISGDQTDDPTPTLEGTLSAELGTTEYLAIFRDGVEVGTATVTDMEWTFSDTLAADGSYTYTAAVKDLAGNLGHGSGDFTLILDTADTTNAMTNTSATETPVGMGETNSAITSSGGDDIIELADGNTNTLVYRLLNETDATGGNGHDQVTGFTVGLFGSDTGADRIDLGELLSGSGLNADSDIDAVSQYVGVKSDGTHTTLQVDLDGSGGTFAMTDIITLNDVNTDLTTLLANQQLALYG
ncbi:Ig-like domain-containing protein [Desulfosarcina sp. OttesenSCG-928-A07]|nr:Ig-like domain-containing protein [Desulfosarcina sp. OttesenSCG-928-A07]